MSSSQTPPIVQSFPPEPGARTEQEIIYEFFRDEFWPDAAYLVFANKFNRSIELSNGKVVILPMPTLEHQRISRDIFKAFDQWLGDRKLGEALYSPHPIRLWPGRYREPDVMVWLNEHRDRLGAQESGPPDIAVEIVSPSNELHDTDTKFTEYAQAGISEYWIVYPQLRQIAVHQLEGRTYKPAVLFRSGQRARSTLLDGFELPLDGLFALEG